MKRRDSNYKVEPSPGPRGFTLVEVIVAIGITAMSVTAMIALLAALSRSAETIQARNQAVQLGSAIEVMLIRLRDQAAGDAVGKLDQLASEIPDSSSQHPLTMVASMDGLRVTLESDADDSAVGIERANRFFLIGIRQLNGALSFTHGSGFLAVSATVSWPYQRRTGPAGSDAVAADMSQASSVILNLGIGP